MVKKNIVEQIEDLHYQALRAQTAGIQLDWAKAKVELDKLYEMTDCVDADIAKHPTMPMERKNDLMREIENAAWAAYLPIDLEIHKNGSSGSGGNILKRWNRVKI